METIFFFDMKTVCLVFGLVALMLCNILLGTALGAMSSVFDWKRMLSGIAKAIIVAAVLALLYAVGYYNADVIVIDMGGETVNLMAAVYLVALAAACTYAVQIITKLKTMLTGELENNTLIAENEMIDLDKIITDGVERAMANKAANAAGEEAGDNEATV